eukprot:1153978-Pelagomonas_calceolata.AAC.1
MQHEGGCQRPHAQGLGISRVLEEGRTPRDFIMSAESFARLAALNSSLSLGKIAPQDNSLNQQQLIQLDTMASDHAEPLALYAQRKHVIINTAKSEVVHFNSSGSDLPVFCIGGVPLAHKESFKYLGMMVHKCMSMDKSSEHAAGTFLASAFRVRQFVCENLLAKRPCVSLWLGKTYVVPAGMYAGQVWGTEYIKAVNEFASDLQVRHMDSLKSTLGVKRTTTNLAVLRECGNEPLQFYWARSVVKIYNSMLRPDSETLRRVTRVTREKGLSQDV